MNQIEKILIKYQYCCGNCIGGRAIDDQCYGHKLNGKNVCELKDCADEILAYIKKQNKKDIPDPEEVLDYGEYYGLNGR